MAQISAQSQHDLQELAANYRLTPATLYSKLDPDWYPKKFLMMSSMKIATTIAQGDGRLIISWPPRHGKSRLGTIATPLWVLENFPGKHVILCTYGAELSTDFGREVKDFIVEHDQDLRVRLRRDVQRGNHFKTPQGGGMTSVGIGGPITGRGADVLIIDDYIKTIAEAQSKTVRDGIWEWFITTALTRLEPGGTVIVIATRWHRDDLIGRALKEFLDWEHIKFKAIADKNDILGRAPGEALFPERYPVNRLLERKKLLGTYFFNALFQQEPEDEDSKLTDRNWLEVIDELPYTDNLMFVRIWDFAGTKGGGDYTVGTLLAIDIERRICFIVDVKRVQLSPLAVEILVKNTAEEDGEDCRILMEEEPGASGKQLISSYQTNVLPGYRLDGSPTVTNKVSRAQPFLAACEDGRVKLLRGSWNEDFLREFDTFPDGDNDDQVDTCAIGYNTILNIKIRSPTWGRRKALNPDKKKVYKDRPVNDFKVGATWGSARRDGRPFGMIRSRTGVSR